MRNSSHKTFSVAGIGFFAVVLCLVAAQGSAEAAKGVCVSAEIEEPFRLPDGSDYPAGRLTLCHHSDYSPTASFHQTKVDGMTVSLQLSRRGESERGDSDEPFVMFTRDTDGTLLLLGYASTGHGKASVHAFPLDRNSRQQVQARVLRPDAEETPIIRLVASLD